MRDDEYYFKSISATLLKEYTRVYYVSIETDAYKWYTIDSKTCSIKLVKEGDDFFDNIVSESQVHVYKDDWHLIADKLQKDKLLESIKSGSELSILYRLVENDVPIYHTLKVIHGVNVDEEYFVLGIVNVDDEIKRKQKTDREYARSLRSANEKARRDELTGIRNSNAYKEIKESMQRRIDDPEDEPVFGIVVCDLNDLKHINDTQGHGMSDEYIQKTSKLICNTFTHSPVFRIGGDEFVAILINSDFEEREELLYKFRSQVIENSKTRSGPVIASGISIYNPEKDKAFSEVFDRADAMMYDNKKALKSDLDVKVLQSYERGRELPIKNKRKLDNLFEILYTVSESDYVYVCDMKYDYSRWSLNLVDDFNMPSDYMYSAGEEWGKLVHPDDIEKYHKAVKETFSTKARVSSMRHRVKNKNGKYVICYTKGFIIVDDKGNPNYFGGVIYTV